MAIQKVSHVSVVVRDQEEALQWYTEMLGFEKRMDNSDTVPGFRWLTVGARVQADLQIVLLKARDEEEMKRIGQGTMWVLETEDCRRTSKELSGRGVKFTSTPEDVPWGVSVCFEDLYGNPYNLVEPRY